MAPGQVYPKKKESRVNRYKENGDGHAGRLLLIVADYSLDTIKSIMDSVMG
jgi:hypothetical protein